MTTSTSSPRGSPPSSRAPLRRLRDGLLDLLFPPRCAGCGRRGTWLCPACLNHVPALAPPWCARCGKPLPAGQRGGTCRSCRRNDLRALDWARAAYPHAGAIRAAIHRFKYEGERARAAHLAPLLVPLLDQLDHRPALRLIPVPLSAARRRERGYNQAEELARRLSVARDRPLDTALERVRATRPQVGLDRAARHANVRDAFAWRGPPLRDANVLLVDDVLTTGATADECAAVLKGAGAGWVGLITVARATDRDGDDADR